MKGRAALTICCGVVALAGFGAARGEIASVSAPGIENSELGRSDYLENCAGCHGINGSTAPAQLPELRGRVGWFMCTPEGRAYLLRLPNVAQSRIKDNGELANMMNFVVFVLGGGSAPPRAKPFTGEEVGRERLLALNVTGLLAERAHQTDAAIRKCHAPASLRLLYPAQRN